MSSSKLPSESTFEVLAESAVGGRRKSGPILKEYSYFLYYKKQDKLTFSWWFQKTKDKKFYIKK